MKPFKLMRIFILLITSIALFSCSQPTASNSLYSDEIADLDKTFATMDSNYSIYQETNIDTLSIWKEEVNKKYNTIKSIYQSDFIDTTFEKIMLIARGQFVKKLSGISKNSGKIEKEYAYSSEQFKTLRENLIHEKLDKKESLIYYSEEKNALILLNAEIVNFNESIKETMSYSGIIIPQLDSIIEVHATKPE